MQCTAAPPWQRSPWVCGSGSRRTRAPTTAMVSLRASTALALLAAVAVAAAGPAANLTDKLQGLILMGAYGDALGAPTEGHNDPNDPCQYTPAAQRTCRLTNVSLWYTDSMYPNTWEIWPSPELVFGRRGVVTDDTSQRLGLLHPWLSSLTEAGQLTDANYRLWMNATATRLYNTTLHEPQDWFGLRRREMMVDLQCMMAVQEEGSTCKNNTFYFKDASTAFGLYEFLELAASFGLARASPAATFHFFYDLATLDELYGHAATGLAAVLTAEAMGVPQTNSSNIAEWLDARLGPLVEEILADPRTSLLAQDELRYVYSRVSDLQVFARKQASPSAFVEQYCSIYDNSAITPQHAMKPHDPMTMLSLMVGAITYARGDAVLGQYLVRNCAGDTDTTGSFLGMLQGAFYGRERASAFPCEGEALGAELDLVVDFVDTFFSVSISSFTATDSVYAHVARLLAVPTAR